MHVHVPTARRWLAAIVTVWIGCLSLPALAASVDDPPYARGPLDLKRLEATKHDATAPLRVRIVTYGRWKARLLDVGGENRLFVLFNVDRSGGADFEGEIFFRDGHLWMRVTKANGDFLRRIRVHHPRQNVARLAMPRGLPNPDGNVWIAAAERYVTESGPCAEICRDRIPSRGWLKVTPGL